MAGLIRQALDEVPEGGLLAFLPGEAEIRRVEGMLGGLTGCTVLPLFGAMEFAAQRAALGPVPGRRVVLATAIAETSLTLPDITVVVDGGKSRRARFDPNSGMSRLVTERVTRAEAEQRRGRAGRVAAGVCYRMWTRGEEGGLAPYPPAEIEAADLTGLALELALWGARRVALSDAAAARPSGRGAGPADRAWRAGGRAHHRSWPGARRPAPASTPRPYAGAFRSGRGGAGGLDGGTRPAARGAARSGAAPVGHRRSPPVRGRPSLACRPSGGRADQGRGKAPAPGNTAGSTKVGGRNGGTGLSRPHRPAPQGRCTALGAVGRQGGGDGAGHTAGRARG